MQKNNFDCFGVHQAVGTYLGSNEWTWQP